MRCGAHLAAVLALLCGGSRAQDKTLADIFAGYDKNKDGVVVRSEFPGSDAQFQEMDLDHDGRVTRAEFAASPFAKRMLLAIEKDRAAPRGRLDPSHNAPQRLAAALRTCDRNGDGRVMPDEWTGSAIAFQSLDLNHDGVLDAADQHLAQAQLDHLAQAQPDMGTPPPAELTSELPAADELLRRLDKDKDQQLSRAEVQRHKIAPLFDAFDRNKDGQLDLEELRRLVDHVAHAVRERAQGSARPRAFAVPFSGWDKNHDGVLDFDEFLEHKELFARIDANHDGRVTPDEVERYRRAIEMDDFLSRFDRNGDGKVTLEEFGGPLEAFQRADRNGDGVVDRDDQ